MKRVLVADDREENFYLLKTLLSIHSDEVVWAKNGAEALEMAQMQPPDLIISDILMPVLDGFGLCRLWKSDPQLSHIPFIFYTATYTEPEDRAFALSLGADGFIIKTTTPEDFLQKLGLLLEQFAAQGLKALQVPAKDETVYFRMYNEVLVHKLELKVQELEQANTALAQSEIGYKLLFENNPVPMWIADVETLRFLIVNDAAVAKYGYSRAEFMFMTLKDIRPPEEVPALLEFIQSQTRQQLSQSGPWRHRLKDGQTIYVDITSHSVEFEGKNARFIMAQDITERKKAEQAILELNAVLEKRVRERTALLQSTNEELQAFSYSVSHDLRAPLRTLSGFSEILAEQYAAGLDEEGQHLLRRIRETSQHMGDLIDALLDLSRLTRRELDLQPVNLSTLAAQIMTELRNGDPDRHVSVVIAEDLMAQGDVHLLRIALQNLLNNAWKYTGTRSQAHIELGLLSTDSPDGPVPTYFVRDNGVGFDMAYARKLFSPFQRLHQAQDFPGTGIGLATVQRVILRHGGRIWAQAAVEQGATFYFTLNALSS